MSEIKKCAGCGEPRYQQGLGAHVGSKRRECMTPDPGEPTMTFYRGNKTAGEFTWPIGAVRDAFINGTKSEEWQLRLAHWPLDRTLRAWLTSPEGFDSNWTDELKYDSLFERVREALRERP